MKELVCDEVQSGLSSSRSLALPRALLNCHVNAKKAAKIAAMTVVLSSDRLCTDLNFPIPG